MLAPSSNDEQNSRVTPPRGAYGDAHDRTSRHHSSSHRLRDETPERRHYRSPYQAETHLYGERCRGDWSTRIHDGGRSSGHDRQVGDRSHQDGEAEKARKLAAMQSAASDLDQERENRLAALEREERAAREDDERARRRGGERGFVNGLHKEAGKLDLGQRIGRNRQGYQRDDD